MAQDRHNQRELRRELLRSLQSNCDRTNVDLASEFGIDASRLSRLRNELSKNGQVIAYKAILNPSRFGLHTLAFVELALEEEKEFEKTLKELKAIPEIQEIHYIQGDFDFLLKIRVHSNAEIMDFIKDQLTARHNVRRVRTIITMGSPKETTDIPLR